MTKRWNLIHRKSLSYLPLLLLAGFVFPSPITHAQSVSSLSISPNQPSVDIGGTTQLTATAIFSDGSSNSVNSSVSWGSADPRIVNVSGSGVASGMATGNVTITASYQGKTASTTISSSMGNIQWSGPLTITQGGTYSGNWKSTDPHIPAVTVATSAPVLIENSHVTGPADLISAPAYGNNLTLKNVIGIGLNPNVRGQANGLFVDAQHSILLDVENCYFENVQFGIWLRGYVGNRDGTQTVKILNNRGRNILGLESDGNIVNTNSTLCVDAAGWGTTNGTVVQQYTCGAQTNQEWQFQPTDSGYYQVVNRNASSQAGHNLVWDVSGGAWAVANGVSVQLWAYGGGTNQQWMPVSLGNGAYKFVARNSSKCLDVPGASSAVLTRLQQYDCNGTAAQSFTLQQK
jgi:Ricin-type beta-trefoil lectin domain-like/Bacterial Ig-like domain (group 2)